MTASATRLRDYAACLRNNIYAFMWLAECTKQAGNWFTYIAAYATIADLSGGDAALHTALFLVCRRLPYLLLFPFSGLAADRLNRGALLVAACLVQSAVSFSLPLVRVRGQLGLLYPLVLLQYSAQAFYDPARISSVPTVVPSSMLCVASTLDLMGFSLMAIFGAAVAGRTAAAYGTSVCFRVEGCTFLVAAALLLRLAAARPPAVQGGAGALGAVSRTARGASTPAEGGAAAAAAVTNHKTSDKGGADGAPGQLDRQQHPESAAAVAAADKPPELEPLLARPVRRGRGRVHGGRGGGGGGRDRDRGCGGCGAVSFLAERRNWDVAALVWCKATGALAWGAADVLNGRFSQMSSMQTLGGPEPTLAAILIAVGLGSVFGPLIANGVTPGVARWWRVSIAAAFGLLAGGYALMASAANVSWVLSATAMRTSGSATLFIHSTATLQHRLPDSVRGRLFALEFVLWTVSEAASTLLAGYALDGLGWSTTRLSGALALLAAAFAVGWSLNALVLWDAEPINDPLHEALLADEPPSVVVVLGEDEGEEESEEGT